MSRSVVVALAVVAACGHRAALPVPDCEHVGDGTAAFWSKQLASATNEQERGYAQKMLEITPARLVRHCKADGWSAAVVECARTDTDRCLALLTPAQQEQLRNDPEAQMITKYEPLQLPTAPPALANAPIVVVTKDAIVFQGKAVARIADVRAAGFTIPALERALPAHPADGTLVVQADQDTDAVVIDRVVHTVQHAGYSNVLFAVKQQER